MKMVSENLQLIRTYRKFPSFQVSKFPSFQVSGGLRPQNGRRMISIAWALSAISIVLVFSCLFVSVCGWKNIFIGDLPGMSEWYFPQNCLINRCDKQLEY